MQTSRVVCIWSPAASYLCCISHISSLTIYLVVFKDIPENLTGSLVRRDCTLQGKKCKKNQIPTVYSL